MRKSICIISFSPIARDARVLRQIKTLSPHYNLTVIGYGSPPKEWADARTITWKLLPAPWTSPAPSANPSGSKNSSAGHGSAPSLKSRIARPLKKTPLYKPLVRLHNFLGWLYSTGLLLLGRVVPSAYEVWYAQQWGEPRALACALSAACDAYHANDWNALPIAGKSAGRNHAKLVFDAHEYAPLEYENRRNWWLVSPMIISMLKKYSRQVDVSTTVAPLIAERYHKEFDLNPVVVMNAPERIEVSPRDVNPNQISLVHHGIAAALRKPELMIETLALCDRRYSLHFMLIPSDYLPTLKALAQKRAPGRVAFHDPVPPESIVQRIAEYDMGFCLIPPTTYNYLACLPNKFFDYVAAGLAVCAGPSPEMVRLISEYGFGVVAPSFNPSEIAAELNRLTAEDISMMKFKALEARTVLNAEVEMGKLLSLYEQLFAGGRECAA